MVNVDTRNNCNKTALYKAGKRGQLNIVELLVHSGADVNIAATRAGQSRCVQRLLTTRDGLMLRTFLEELNFI